VRWKAFNVLYRKFIQNNVYQILSELIWFCGGYDKNILVFSRFTVYLRMFAKSSTLPEREMAWLILVKFDCRTTPDYSSVFRKSGPNRPKAPKYVLHGKS